MIRTYELIDTSPKPRPRRPWWQDMRLVEFEAHMPSLGDTAIELLWLDIRNAVSSCGQRASDTSLATEARRRARTALRFLTEKRNLVHLEMVRRGRFERRQGEP